MSIQWSSCCDRSAGCYQFISGLSLLLPPCHLHWWMFKLLLLSFTQRIPAVTFFPALPRHTLAVEMTLLSLIDCDIMQPECVFKWTTMMWFLWLHFEANATWLVRLFEVIKYEASCLIIRIPGAHLYTSVLTLMSRSCQTTYRSRKTTVPVVWHRCWCLAAMPNYCLRGSEVMTDKPLFLWPCPRPQLLSTA